LPAPPATVCLSAKTIVLCADGGFIRIDASGVRINGAVVRLDGRPVARVGDAHYCLAPHDSALLAARIAPDPRTATRRVDAVLAWAHFVRALRDLTPAEKAAIIEFLWENLGFNPTQTDEALAGDPKAATLLNAYARKGAGAGRVRTARHRAIGKLERIVFDPLLEGGASPPILVGS
jgi:hypothetical protein